MEYQVASRTVALMLEDAKNMLKAAKQIAEDSGIGFCLQELYEEVTEESPDWYSSSC